MPSVNPCPSCEGRAKGCDDCYGEGTYNAYATEQMDRLLIYMVKRGLINESTLKLRIQRREHNADPSKDGVDGGDH